MAAALHHVARPVVPWRAGPALTECGRRIHPKVKLTTFDDIKTEIDRRVREGTIRRSQLYADYCQICVDTARNHRFGTGPHRSVDTMDVLAREIAFVRYKSGSKDRRRLAHELYAIERLIETHRAEFDDLLDGEAVLSALGWAG